MTHASPASLFPGRLLAAAALAHALPAQAATGNLMPQLVSFFIVVPFLLLLPAVGIAASSIEWGRKLPWIAAAVALAFACFGTMWWAAQVKEVMVGDTWPMIYFWTAPGLVLWFAFWYRTRSR